MERGSSFTLMATSMMVSGQTTKQTVSVSTSMSMELSTRECGEMISSMVRVLRHGQMAADMKESTLSAVNTESDSISGMTVLSTLVNGRKIRSPALVSTLG